jgi:predicted RecB family nuclease
MKLRDHRIVLAATDVANHLACAHLTNLNRLLARGEIAEPAWQNPHLAVLQQRGVQHEKDYLDSLRARGLRVADLTSESDPAATLAAMQAGADVIYQGTLSAGEWGGRPDILLRVDHSDHTKGFAGRTYEVVDCKLASETKAESLLQLCLYSEILAGMQELAPEHFHVIRPNVQFAPESYRFSAFAAFYRSVKRSLHLAVQSPVDLYPEPVSHCDICRWWKVCDHRRRADDHLSFVAGASRQQRKELALHGVSTLEALATLPLPIPFNPARGARETYTRIREQARIQFESRCEGHPKFELLALEPGKGLFRLPAPSPGDIFFDFEGDPFVEDGGREYLFGIVTAAPDGSPAYTARWALDRAQERSAF